ncbi:unnamed protein product [marine sediment metagenome]|uniref:Uncharacterized protein n=1 Tax=marine sediment metagenome TaxID=412755 RepID=X0Z064_9ZZZZ
MNTHRFIGVYRERSGSLVIVVPINDANYIRKKMGGDVIGEGVPVEVEL